MSLTSSAKIDNHDLKDALEALLQEQCVAIPTETVYGLAADATSDIAVARIFELKQRPTFNPLICHVDGISMASEYGDFDPVSLKLAHLFWPGPLTLILPLKANSKISSLATAGLDSIGLRHPRGIASQLISEFGKPLAAPSANRSGRISPTQATHVSEEFPELDLIIMDQGACDVGLESTILKVIGNEIILLRPGSITADMIEDEIGIRPVSSQGNKIEAPGMMQSHYAPDAAVMLNAKSCSDDNAWLQFGSDNVPHPNALNLSPKGDLVEAAANLYKMLKALDALNTLTICVSPIPETGIGVAINDRLRRAAAPKGDT